MQLLELLAFTHYSIQKQVKFKESSLAVEQKQSTMKYLSLILRISIAVIACWLIFKDLNYPQLLTIFRRLNIFIVLTAILMFMVGLCLIGFRWWVFLRAQTINISVFMAIKLTFLGQFFTNFMPSAVGGDLVRAWYVSRHTDKKIQAALGVAADRIMGLTSTFILAISSYLLFMRDEKGVFQVSKKESVVDSIFSDYQISLLHVLFAALIVIGGLYVLSRFVDLKRFIRKCSGFVVHLLVQIKNVFGVYVRHPLILAFGLGITLFLQSAVILSLWLVGQNLGITAQARYYFIFFPMVWVIGSVPISIAGIGILEGGLVFLFVQFTNADPEIVVALALCHRLTWVFASLPGMVVHLTGAHRYKGRKC